MSDLGNMMGLALAIEAAVILAVGVVIGAVLVGVGALIWWAI